MDVQSFALRCRWPLRALERNPLIRVSDRLEALAFLAVLAMIVLAIPFAASVEAKTYDSTLHTAEEQAQGRHSVHAVVVQGSVGLPTDFDTSLYVQAQWHEGTRLRTEQVVSPSTVKAGDPLTLWLDQTGRVVPAPLTPSDAKVSAVTFAWTVWVLIVVFSGILALGIRLGLDRSRARAWERELQVLAHNDDGWANRRS
jgi:hypothetical protein